MTKDEAFARLARSPFRSHFHLGPQELAYIDKNGMEVIRSHCVDFVSQRLSAAFPANDGKQTPMRGHPVFVAQHACACCCRGCLNKWYRVPLGRPLNAVQQERIVNFLMEWIRREYEPHLRSMNNKGGL